MSKRKVLTVVLALVLTAVLAMGGGLFVIAIEKTKPCTYVPESYINVVALGATADDDIDDTKAFVKAFALGMPVYVPQGTFRISQSLHITSPLLVGAGKDKTHIVAKVEKITDPIFFVGNGGSYIRDISIGYDESQLTGSEGVGERVCMYTGNVWAFAMGASLRNVCFENCGTGIYSLDGDQYAMFSATLESVTFKDFTFRGLDIRGLIRTGNYFRNLYFTSKYTADSALYMDGEESETTFTGLVVENMTAREPVHILGTRALRMSGITVRNVKLSENESGFIYLNNTNGTIDTVTVTGCEVKDYCSLFKMGEGEFYVNHGKGSSTSYITVNTLNCENIHSASLAGKHFSFASRDDSNGLYSLEIQNYVYTTKHGDDAEYKAFAKDNENINLTLMGKEH